MDDIFTLPFDLRSRSERASALAVEVTQLFELHRSPLFRYLASLGLGQHDAEEIIQEVFLALFRHLKAGKPRDNLRGWVFRTAHNLALKLRTRVYGRMADADPQVFELCIHPDPNPEQLLAAKQHQAMLSAVFRALPERERACLALRAEGFRYREIAEIQGMSLGSVAAALARALGKLATVEAMQ